MTTERRVPSRFLAFALAVTFVLPPSALALVTPVPPTDEPEANSAVHMLTTKANRYNERELIRIQNETLNDSAIENWIIDGITVKQYLNEKVKELEKSEVTSSYIVNNTIAPGLYPLFTEMAEYCLLSANGFDLAAQRKLKSYLENVLLNIAYDPSSRSALARVISETVQFGEEFYPRITPGDWQSFRRFRAMTEARLTDTHFINQVIRPLRRKIARDHRHNYSLALAPSFMLGGMVAAIGAAAHAPYYGEFATFIFFAMFMALRLYLAPFFGSKSVKSLSHHFVKSCRDVLAPEEGST